MSTCCDRVDLLNVDQSDLPVLYHNELIWQVIGSVALFSCLGLQASDLLHTHEARAQVKRQSVNPAVGRINFWMLSIVPNTACRSKRHSPCRLISETVRSGSRLLDMATLSLFSNGLRQNRISDSEAEKKQSFSNVEFLASLAHPHKFSVCSYVSDFLTVSSRTTDSPAVVLLEAPKTSMIENTDPCVDSRFSFLDVRRPNTLLLEPIPISLRCLGFCIASSFYLRHSVDRPYRNRRVTKREVKEQKI